MHAPPALPSPRITVFKSDPASEPLRILRWQLEEGETLLALADARLDRFWDDSGFLGVTDRRVLVMSQSDMKKYGTVEHSFNRADIRFVRFTEGSSDKSPAIDVINRDENLRFTFGSWAHEESARMAAGRLSNLLASTMHIPVGEIPADPLRVGYVPCEIEASHSD